MALPESETTRQITVSAGTDPSCLAEHTLFPEKRLFHRDARDLFSAIAENKAGSTEKRDHQS